MLQDFDEGQDEAQAQDQARQGSLQLRQTSVEPVFGHIKEPMGFRQVPLRGQDKAQSIWWLQCAAFNLMKLYSARRAACAAPALA